MVVLSQLALDQFSLIQTCQPTSVSKSFPAIDLANPEAKKQIVEACEEFGFFELVNHGVPPELMARLETEALRFFSSAQSEKEKVAPLGYGKIRIGPNGDMGWVEYLLLSTSSKIIDQISSPIFQGNQSFSQNALIGYLTAVKEVACEVLELIAEGLKMEPKNVFARLLRDENSDCLLRLNHYPPCSELQELSGQNVVGFGEHTDPQIISVLRSNDTSGLEICLKDGTWVSVPPEHNSFFISVGDCLQVMTNGRLKSVRHRVSANSLKSRVSMIYFGGPTLSEKIGPYSCKVEEGEEKLYKEFTWTDYKKSAYSSRLGDNRLAFFRSNK